MMPWITIEGPKITREQKSRLVGEVVAKAAGIYNLPEDAFETIIKENELDNIGKGTKLLSDLYKRL